MSAHDTTGSGALSVMRAQPSVTTYPGTDQAPVGETAHALFRRPSVRSAKGKVRSGRGAPSPSLPLKRADARAHWEGPTIGTCG